MTFDCCLLFFLFFSFFSCQAEHICNMLFAGLIVTCVCASLTAREGVLVLFKTICKKQVSALLFTLVDSVLSFFVERRRAP